MERVTKTDFEALSQQLPSSLLGGFPTPTTFVKGLRWNLTFVDEEGEVINAGESKDVGDLSRIWFSVDRTSKSYEFYDPFNEMAALLAAYWRLGEAVWSNGMQWSDDIAADTRRVLGDFGGVYTMYDLDLPLDFLWNNARVIAWFLNAVQSLSVDRVEDRQNVIEGLCKIIDLRTNGSEVTAPVGPSPGDVAREWSRYRDEGDFADDPTYQQRVRGAMTTLVNVGMETYRVTPQIGALESGAAIVGYKPTTLLGAMWAGLASLLVNDEIVKRCGNSRCTNEPVFITSNHRKLYCSDRCKAAAKKRRQRSGTKNEEA